MTADCSAAGGVESFVTLDVDCSVSGCAKGSVAGVTEYFGGAFMVGSAYPLSWSSFCSSSFLQMGQCGHHEHFSVACIGITMAWGNCCNFGWFFCFDGGDRCGDWSRGNWPVLSGLKQIF